MVWKPNRAQSAKNKVQNSRLSFALLIASVVLISAFNSLAQSTQEKRPKLKDFGSSLKRLKWDPEKKTAVEEKGSNSSSDGLDDDVIRIETNLVTCDILVVDRQGNIVTGLTANDFTITEDGTPQQVGHFLLGDNISVPRTIVLIIDHSTSQYPYLRRSIDAAKLMVDKLSVRDRMAIVTDDVEVLVDFTDDKKKLKEKLESLTDRVKDYSFLDSRPNRKFSKSAQYSALMATLNEAFLEEDLRPIIIFQTDGDEIYNLRNPIIEIGLPPDLPDDVRTELAKAGTSPTQTIAQQLRAFSLADVYRAAEKSRATIYTVVPGIRLLNRSPDERIALTKMTMEQRTNEMLSRVSPEIRKKAKELDERWRKFSPANLAFRAHQDFTVQAALAAVAPRTGGWTEFLEKPEEAEGIYNRIFADITKRYIIGYYPTNKERDGKRRRIKFEVAGHPEYYIIGRNSYYAPGVR